MQDVIYFRDFDTKDKSYDEKTVVSSEAFEEINKALDYSSDERLRLIKLSVGVAVDVGTSLSVGKNGEGKLIVKIMSASPLGFDQFTMILLEKICGLAKSVKIESEDGKCAVSVGI